MEIYKLYLPSFATVVQIPHFYKYNPLILEWIKTTPLSKPDGWNCEVKTTFSREAQAEKNVLNTEPFKELKAQIEECFTLFYSKTFGQVKVPFTVEESWVNVYEKGNYQESHSHIHSLFAGSYYVSAPEGSGALVLEGEGETEKFINPQEGMLVFFEGEMPHRVEKNQSSENRISLSFNIN